MQNKTQVKKKKDFKTVIFIHIITSIAIIIITYYVTHTIDAVDKKIHQAAIEGLDTINLPSHILFQEEIKESQWSPEPIPDNNRQYKDKILNQKMVLNKSLKLEEKCLLLVYARAHSLIDTLKLTEFHRLCAHSCAGHGIHHSHGFVSTTIFIDDILSAGNSADISDSLKPTLSVSVFYAYVLEPGNYKIRVESIFYGFLSQPYCSANIIGERMEAIELKDLLNESKETVKKPGNSLISNSYRSIEKDKNGRLKPSVTPPRGIEKEQSAQTGCALNGAGSPGSRSASSDRTGLTPAR